MGNNIGGNREENFTILYGTNYENTIHIRMGDDTKMTLALISEVSLLAKDLETPNTLTMIPKRKSKIEASNSTWMKFLIALDMNNNIYFYNLDNLKIILHDIIYNPHIWKKVLNQKLTDNPENYKQLLNNIKSFHEISYSFSMKSLNSIYGPHEITYSFFYSVFDLENSKFFS